MSKPSVVDGEHIIVQISEALCRQKLNVDLAVRFVTADVPMISGDDREIPSVWSAVGYHGWMTMAGPQLEHWALETMSSVT